MKTITLYRPVGLREMELIAATKYSKFPPRLEWQPIFYPVLNQGYAEEIAFKWNLDDEFSGHCGIVTAFGVASEYIGQFKIQIVGGSMHNELWIPAEELGNFNTHIQGDIRIVNAFFGKAFKGSDDEKLQKSLNQFKK